MDGLLNELFLGDYEEPQKTRAAKGKAKPRKKGVSHANFFMEAMGSNSTQKVAKAGAKAKGKKATGGKQPAANNKRRARN